MTPTIQNAGMIKSTQNKLNVSIGLELIDKWKKILKLEHWTIGISTTPPRMSSHAMEIAMTPTREHAAVRISGKAWNYSVQTFEKLIIHELLHILFDPIQEEYEDKYKELTGVWIHNSRHEKLVETTLDRISKVLYDLNT